MNFDDEKDLQQILFLAARILERRHNQTDGSAPALIASPTNPDNPPQLSDDGKTIFFPALRDVREVTGSPAAEVNSQKEVSLTFSSEEISKMPRYFRKLFRTQRKTAHVRLKDDGVYEIRLQIDGVRISASSRFLDEAKIKFLQKLKLFEKGDLQARQHAEKKPVAPQVLPVPAVSVSDYALQYLETFKKPNISEKHFYNLSGIVRRHISRFFGDKLLQDLTATDCQKFLNELIQSGKFRTAEDAKSILDWICSAAVADRLLPVDVMAQVQIQPHKRTAGKVIPREFIRAFLAKEPQSRAELCLWLLIFTGMRPCEVFALTFDECGFVSVQTAKKKKWEEPETRRIPLHSALLPYIERIRAALPVSLFLLERAFKKHFPPEFRLYDLRHTFTTAAQQAHCYKSWVDYVTGHKGGANTTDRVYTHWEDDFQREEIEKLKY